MNQEQLSYNISKFAAQFCREVENKGNVVCSPVSAEICLALLALGSEGQTRRELMDALLMTDDDQIRSSFSYLRGSLEAVEGVTLNVANKLYIKEGRGELRARFKTDVEEVFGGNVEQLDFENGDMAADTINSWVSKQTNDKIKDIVAANDFDALTRIVLVNAIYFEGAWENQFSRSWTRNRKFHINSTTTIEVPMMYMHQDVYDYMKNDDLNAQILKMPYRGEKSNFVIVLPNEIEGLNEVMKKIAEGHDILSDMKKMRRTTINLSVPKFKAETNLDLKEILKKVGIKSIFKPEMSDINMMAGSDKLYVSDAVQKAYIDVNEKGSEAAAASGVRMMLCCLREYPHFTANRPFLFLLMVNDTVIFIGTYRGEEADKQ